MCWSRVFWGVLAVLILILMFAPLASYCLGRDEDYDDKASRAAPRLTSQQSVAVPGPLIVRSTN